MQIINTHNAKTNLSQLLHQVSQGEEFIIGKAGTPVAKLVPYKTVEKKRVGGQLKGKISIHKDFDKLPEEFMQHFKK